MGEIIKAWHFCEPFLAILGACCVASLLLLIVIAAIGNRDDK